MAFSVAYEDQLEIIDENDPYFIGRTDQWNNEPDGKLVLGYEDSSTKQIMPIEYFGMLGDPNEYNVRDSMDCAKHICIGSGVLRAPRDRDDLCELDFCEGCHERAKEGWRKLLEDNSGLGVSKFI